MQSVIQYLDDFSWPAGTRHAMCAAQLKVVLDTFEDLGIPIAMHKLEGPSSLLNYKVWCKVGYIRTYMKELDFQVGKLLHACKVEKPGKAFTWHLYQKLAEQQSCITMCGSMSVMVRPDVVDFVPAGMEWCSITQRVQHTESWIQHNDRCLG